VSRAAIDLSTAFVVVSGGSSGIGQATACEFARRGACIALIARNVDKLEAAAQTVRAAAGAAGADQREGWFVSTYACDLSDLTETLDAFASLTGEHGVPDVLVNSAGVIYPGEFVNMPAEHFDVNVSCGYWSVVNPCRAVAPAMVSRGSGHIVNVSSVAGYLGIYGYTGYSSAKFAVMGFTEALRFELRPEGVGVSVACPPDTATPALEFEHTLRPTETDVIAGNIKPIAPEKVAAAIVRGVERDRYYIIPDALSAFYFRLKGLLPELFFAIVDGDVAKARKAKG